MTYHFSKQAYGGVATPPLFERIVMGMDWAVQTIEKERSREANNRKVKSADGEQKQDKRVFYCTTCKHCFQPNIFSVKRFYKENEIEIYVDFPSIGKERVSSCANCN